MRLYLKLSPNKEIVPFNYQCILVGVFHKWIGQNELHDELSLYSLSWLSGGKVKNDGLDFSRGTIWYISSHDSEFIRSLIKGIKNEPDVFCGMEVQEIIISEPPQFEAEQKFMLSSPVFIKRTVGERIQFYYYDDPEADRLLTETLIHKTQMAHLSAEGLSVAFDKTFTNPKKKKINFGGIDCKGSICPIIIKGSQEQLAFAWNVGVGNSTGIGFGALK